MNNGDFYIAAATVIPLLLIAVMATRSLRPGALRQQPTSTVLVFGLPVIGELAAFSFLFFEPVPTAAAVILAVVTWAGLLSQLALAVWWLAELLRRDSPSAVVPAVQAVKDSTAAHAPAGGTRGRRTAEGSSPSAGTPARRTTGGGPSRTRAQTRRETVCPMCGQVFPEEHEEQLLALDFCPQCRAPLKR